MKVFKVLGSIIASIGGFIENIAELGNYVVGDEGLKSTVKYSFQIVNVGLEGAAKMTEIESKQEVQDFYKENGLTPTGKPKGTK